MNNLDVKKVSCYYFKEELPEKVRLGIFQKIDKVINKLLATASNKKDIIVKFDNEYVIDIATGISIPIMKYNRYTYKEYHLAQENRLENTMDKNIHLCVFLDNNCAVSQSEVDEYVRNNQGAEYYNNLLELANKNSYFSENPNGKKEKKVINKVKKHIDDININNSLILIINQINALITELKMTKQTEYYNRLNFILNKYSELEKENNNITLDLLKNETFNQLSDLKKEIEDSKNSDILKKVYTTEGFNNFLEYLSVLDNPKEKLSALYQELSSLVKEDITSSIDEQLEMVDLVIDFMIDNIKEIDSLEQKEYFESLDDVFKKEIIRVLELNIDEDILKGFYFRKLNKMSYEYFLELLDLAIVRDKVFYKK